jgi:hypothetical protein
MKSRIANLIIVATLALGYGAFSVEFPTEANHKSAQTVQHSEWIQASLRQIETIKVGMTRGDLLKVFKEEGGLSARLRRRYVYGECPNIKVDVEFEAAGTPGDKLTEHADDRIIKISKPFLEWSITD